MNAHNTADRRQPAILSAAYWRLASQSFHSTRMLTFAALIVALRVAVKAFRIPLATGLSLSFDCYINSLGSIVYGPLMGLLVGAVSDTLGCLLFPSGPYFLPFILTEMSSSFIFALFFWQRPLSVNRSLAAKFTVNAVCNMVMTSILMKWFYYYFYGIEKAETYAVINLVRICKNLVLFPLEALLIVMVLQAAIPVLKRFGFSHVISTEQRLEKKHYITIALLLLLSIGLILLYVFWLEGFIKLHNFKWL